MKYYLRLGLVLLVITALASGVLAFINSFTDPIITNNQLKTQEEARKEVLPQAVTFVKDSLQVEAVKMKRNPLKIEPKNTANAFYYYVGKDDNGNIVGYTFVASKYGYSSNVQTMVGVDQNLFVQKIKIIYQSETPGLGANCEKADFAAKFEKKQVSQLKVDKDGGTIESITGATITTRAVTNSIREGLEHLQKMVKKESKEVSA